MKGSPGARWLFLIVLALCFTQFPRSIDFMDYVNHARWALAEGFMRPPYPVGTAQWGDFFQSPIVVLLLVPLAPFPLPAAKFIWAVLNTAGVSYVLHRTLDRPIGTSSALFLVLLFAHPISDIYVSGNINFALLVCLLAGWHGLHSPRRTLQALGGGLVALAICIKLQPVLFLAWFVGHKEWPRVGYILLGLLFWIAFSALTLPHTSFWPWWEGWWHAVGLYHLAAPAGTVSYQSPPAALFRWLTRFTDLSYTDRYHIMSTFAAGAQGLLFLYALGFGKGMNRNTVALPILLSAFFIGGPFSWALTLLFCFPLVYHATKNQIPRLAWIMVVLLATIPKALWPERIWQQLAEGNAPAVCIGVILAQCLWRLRLSVKLTP